LIDHPQQKEESKPYDAKNLKETQPTFGGKA